eukprot:6183135-Pleurochrysis_carterae.AAC.1
MMCGGPEACAHIHMLFSAAARQKIERHVTLTATGYIAETIVLEPELVQVLQKHVAGMHTRLIEGNPIREFDPLFYAIFHEKNMTMTVQNTSKGVLVTESASSPCAVAIAHAHSAVVTGFATRGMPEAHTTHPIPSSCPFSKPPSAGGMMGGGMMGGLMMGMMRGGMMGNGGMMGGGMMGNGGMMGGGMGNGGMMGGGMGNPGMMGGGMGNEMVENEMMGDNAGSLSQGSRVRGMSGSMLVLESTSQDVSSSLPTSPVLVLVLVIVALVVPLAMMIARARARRQLQGRIM